MRAKSDERRHAIMHAASEVFRDKGYAGASMSEISARAGGSKCTLYSYFPSKHELFSAVMLDQIKRLGVPDLFAELEQAEDVMQAVRHFARGLTRLLASAEVVDFLRMIIAEGARSPLGKLVYQNGPAVYWRRFAEFYETQADKGVFRDADPWRAAMHIHALCMAGANQWLLEGAVSFITVEEIGSTAEAAADVFLRAYALKSEVSKCDDLPKADPN